MGIMARIVPGLLSGILLAAYCLSGSRTAHVAAAGAGPTELGPLA